MIKLLRVDHRLLHGQVAFSWCHTLGANAILVVSDSVAKDEIRMKTMRLAKPSGVKLVIKSVDDSIAAITSGVTDKYYTGDSVMAWNTPIWASRSSTSNSPRVHAASAR